MLGSGLERIVAQSTDMESGAKWSISVERVSQRSRCGGGESVAGGAEEARAGVTAH